MVILAAASSCCDSVGCVTFQIVFSQSVSDYNDIVETYKLKEFEKECIIMLPEGFVSVSEV